jgi:succinate dehydrogenase / fumarate reductase flavoprotein subunit
MTLVADLIARSALMRKESRGAHTRVDAPASNKDFEKVNVVAQLVDGKIELSLAERPPLPDDLRAIVYPTSEASA